MLTYVGELNIYNLLKAGIAMPKGGTFANLEIPCLRVVFLAPCHLIWNIKTTRVSYPRPFVLALLYFSIFFSTSIRTLL